MPKNSHPHSRMHETPEQRGPETWNKQPRPLEDGNWVCDDPHCGNVNYPRRTECFKCRKHRGPMGDAVVKAYIDKLKLVKGGSQHITRNFHSVRGVIPSGPALLNELDPWLGLGIDQMQFGSLRFDDERCYYGRRPTISAGTEGKHLAEHLIACFAASSDPIGDAGECLASAALWLQTLKSRFQAEEHTLSTPPLMSTGSSPLGNLQMSGNGPVNMLSQSHFGANMGTGTVLSMGNLLNRTNSSMSNFSSSQTLLPASLRWEDYKDRPSDFLREFGDPAAVNASAVGGGMKPQPGVNGNWECEDCKNVNFPRRTSCFQCHKKRGAKGDELVRNYVRGLFDDADTMWTA